MHTLGIDADLVLAFAIEPERREQVIAAQAILHSPNTQHAYRYSSCTLKIDLRNFEARQQEYRRAGFEVTEEALVLLFKRLRSESNLCRLYIGMKVE
jgi:hypothetical protein